MVPGSIPGQGTRLEFGPGAQMWACEVQLIEMFLSLSLSFPSPLSKNKSVKSLFF